MIRAPLALLWLACETPPQRGTPDALEPPKGEATEQMPLRDQEQQHPPLPADNPAWEWDAGGFVSDFGWYGEHSWADVRMRVAGHLSIAARDVVRIHAERGDFAAAVAASRAQAELLAELDTGSSQIAAEIVGLLREAAQRDAAWMSALAKGRAPDGIGLEGVDALRARYLALALQTDPDPAELRASAEALDADLIAALAPRPDLDLDDFTDFDARHALRVRLFAAYLDALDPLGLDERWGYWEAPEIQRQVALLRLALAELAELDAPAGQPELLGTPPDLSAVPALRWPSALAERLHSIDQAPDFTAEGLGWLPTGDSLIDVAAQPGPRAIGTLERLGLDDPEHRAWLTEEAEELDRSLGDDPADVAARVEQMTERIDALGHGSRFYNIKQIRNDAVRQLARAGHAETARQILRDNYPLHHQDWACPNRQGILEAIEGRLLAEAGQTDAALSMLETALASGRSFLSDVDTAAARTAQPGKAPHGKAQQGPSGPPGPGQGAPGAHQGPPGPPPGGSRGRAGPPGPPPGRHDPSKRPGAGQGKGR